MEPIETKRLRLRAFTMADAPRVAEICAEREIAANTRTVPHPYTIEHATGWLKTLSDGTAPKGVVFAITLKDSGLIVGAMGLGVDTNHDHAELGYWIDKAHWNKGIASEAVPAVLRYGFEVLKLHRIHAHYLARNPASGKVMIKAGMVYEGTMRQHVKKWGVYEDTVHYAALASEWKP
jgi:RimJ/RimL family protein N-acetyltransferase